MHIRKVAINMMDTEEKNLKIVAKIMTISIIMMTIKITSLTTHIQTQKTSTSNEDKEAITNTISIKNGRSFKSLRRD